MPSILDQKPEDLDAAQARVQPGSPQATRSVLDTLPADETEHFEETPQGPHSLASGAFSGMRRDGMSGIVPGIKGAVASQIEAQNGEPIQGDTPVALPAASLPAGVSKLAAFLNKTAPRRIAVGGAQGAVADPEHPFQGFMKGAALSAVGEGASKALTSAGDATMQAAVGRKKFTPGVGTTLANEGIGGTKRMMTEQVDNALASRGQEMQDLAASIPDNVPINSQEIGQTIAQESSRPLLVPGKAPSSADMPKLQKIAEFSQDVASRGSETGSQALQRRIAAGQRSYRGKEDPLQSLLGNLSKKEQILYSKGLNDAYRSSAPAIVPEAKGISGKIQAAEGVGSVNPEALSQADKAYGALKRAESGLAEETKLPTSLFQLLSTSAKSVPGGSIGLSAIGQALTKSGQGVEKLNNPLLRQILLEQDEEE